jgi:thiazole synthase
MIVDLGGPNTCRSERRDCTAAMSRQDRHVPPANGPFLLCNRPGEDGTQARKEIGRSDSIRTANSFMFPATSDKPSKLKIADREFTSRLLVGTGKFASNELMRDALIASGTEIVTVALRRADVSGKGDPYANILDFIDPKRFLLLPNTSGARNATEAVRLARLAASAGLPTWIKLEIHPDPRYLLPDPVETLLAAEILVKEGFTVLPYINADPVLAKRLQDVGTATVMPLGSPIGSNRGIETRPQIEIIIEQATVPVVVDAGLGAPSQAAEAMEMGADAVLVNTAIAIASDPVRMAQAFRKAIEAGREAHEIGLAARLSTAAATSPLTSFFSVGKTNRD